MYELMLLMCCGSFLRRLSVMGGDGFPTSFTIAFCRVVRTCVRSSYVSFFSLDTR